MISDSLLFSAPLLIVAGWGTILLGIDLLVPRRHRWITPLLATLGLAAALIMVVVQFGGQAELFSGMLIQDPFGSYLQIIFLLTAILGIALAFDYLKRMGLDKGEYYTLLLFTVSGMMLMAMAGDLIIVFLALELLSFPLYILSGFAQPAPESEESAMKYFLLGAFSSGFVLYGIALVYGAAQTTRLDELVALLQTGGYSHALMVGGAALILVGLAFKIAAVPFHMWTPDVYQGAPSSIVAFMTVGAKAGGFAALLRLFIAAFPSLSATWAPVLIGLSALTMIWGNVAAVAQSNIKRMLAYSSIAHAGYMLMVLPASTQGSLAPAAVSSALFYLFAYMATNLGAWGVVLAVEKHDGQGGAIEDFSGLASRHPLLAMAMAVFMFSLIGVPPTLGFVGKYYIFQTAVRANLIGLALIGVLTSLVSAYYYLRVVVVMYMKPGDVQPRSEVWLNGAVGLTAAATIVLGILPSPLFDLASRSVLMLFGS
jgi:NADH-quinone oxidoreductase subunit N